MLALLSSSKLHGGTCGRLWQLEGWCIDTAQQASVSDNLLLALVAAAVSVMAPLFAEFTAATACNCCRFLKRGSGGQAAVQLHHQFCSL